MDGKHKMAGPDFLTAIVLVCFGAGVFFVSNRMQVFRMLIVSPGLFPMILGGVFALAGIVMLVISVKNGGIAHAKKIISAEYLGEVVRSPRTKRGGIIFLLILAYVILFGNEYLAKLTFPVNVGDSVVPVNIGFIAVTAGYLFFTFSYLKAMSRPAALVVSLVSAIAIYYAFNQGFGIPIP